MTEEEQFAEASELAHKIVLNIPGSTLPATATLALAIALGTGINIMSKPVGREIVLSALEKIVREMAMGQSSLIEAIRESAGETLQ